MKVLVIVAALALLVLLLLGRGARAAKPPPRDRSAAPPPPSPPPSPPEGMVACAHCGLHVPRSEALADGDDAYCSAGHRRAGPRRPPAP
ncbi:MAG TPA: PP0621 family protein [Burkholderiaceae bacterium]|nr:PP0621 family protein [Burkholderiaceae bacterium]